MIDDPPSDAGADQLTTACASPARAVTPVGAPGAEAALVGTTAFEAAEAALVPTAFVAVTVNVYGVPFVSPVTVALSVEPPTLAVAPPGLAVTA